MNLLQGSLEKPQLELEKTPVRHRKLPIWEPVLTRSCYVLETSHKLGAWGILGVPTDTDSLQSGEVVISWNHVMISLPKSSKRIVVKLLNCWAVGSWNVELVES